MTTAFTLNGRKVAAASDADTPLLWVLRDELGLTGTKYGCGVAQCGACTVHVDGSTRRACVTPLGSVAGRAVTTIEGAAAAHGTPGRVARALQQAWTELDVPQCGFCQSGQIMAATVLVAAIADPSDADINAAMAGNICRCATYLRIRQGIRLAASRLREQR
ncbi:(2Fe-2S)-binding protein [Novosphingobium resinovorum]|uniref:(2Fe-2S)-binding protein n=1 Tax=Novosphingobium resinovorum TaxID=158500 RepID=UPI002ED1E5AA|nr:(2Fe-2S)-binding protein [Novosphingobium resinovorum]